MVGTRKASLIPSNVTVKFHVGSRISLDPIALCAGVSHLIQFVVYEYEIKMYEHLVWLYL